MNAINPIWAKRKKIDSNNNREIIITLSEHINHILEKFDQLKNKLKPELHKPIELAIQLHDIGKVLPYFQRKNLGNLNYKPFDVSVEIYHSILSVLFINKNELKRELLNHGINDSDIEKFILSAVAFHHWKDKFEDLFRYGNKNFEKLMNKPDDFKKALINNLKDEMKSVNGFNINLIELDEYMLEGLSGEKQLPFYEYVIPPYQLYYLPKRIEIINKKIIDWILIAGFLIRCDHFASFCEEEGNYDLPIEIFPPNYNTVIQNTIDQIKKRANLISSQDIWQLQVIELTKNNNTILIAPTGIGKTEFAFLWGAGEKFFYTLPLRAAVEQIYERASEIFNTNKDVLDNTSQQTKIIEKVGLLHFDADIYLIGSEDQEYSILQYDTARQLAFPVTISTGDQFFPYALRPPGYEKIYSIFSYAKLIVDEVQAYDPVASAIIVKFIEDVNNMGSNSLLMTATFPAFIEYEIKQRSTSIQVVNLYEKNKSDLKSLKKHKIKFHIINNSKSKYGSEFSIDSDLLNQIIDLGKRNRVLVILNTIALAQTVFEELKNICDRESIKIFLLHSRFTFNDRENIRKKIEKEFQNPKSQNEVEGKILISTQVLEAALDIDADFLFTEIAPLDSLIQRMGRVLRRYRNNYKHIGESNVKIIVYSNGLESGNGKVYKAELVNLTLKLLQSEIDKTINLEDEIANYYSEKSKKKNKLEKLSLDLQNGEIILSEFKKFELVNKLYGYLLKYREKSDYLKDFYLTLELLDAGYMSDKKSDAQKKFRSMISYQVIPENRKEELKNAIAYYCMKYIDEKRPYTMFKEKIISEFVINVNGLKNQSKFASVSKWLEEIENEINLKEEHKIKLINWTENIFFVNYNYDSQKGLDKNINQELSHLANIL
ncbi:MAG: CRISPR-associated helicase Cas3' [Candidatus Omnitrophica bacterium]|nr:CRISPR-associated helicase Cas3' [Candidatus Omnitrophota bacterium]